jgi:hypothetical protein
MSSGSTVIFFFFRFSIDLDKSRELEIGIYWRDWRSLCAIKFLRLEEFIDDIRHGMALQLEPQGLLFAEVMISMLLKILFMSCSSALRMFLLLSCDIPCSAERMSSSVLLPRGLYHENLRHLSRCYCVFHI